MESRVRGSDDLGKGWYMLGSGVFLPLGVVGAVVGVVIGLLTGTWIVLWAGVGLVIAGVALPMIVMAVITSRVQAGAAAFGKDLERKRAAEAERGPEDHP